jgi:hypothetical protein
LLLEQPPQPAVGNAGEVEHYADTSRSGRRKSFAAAPFFNGSVLLDVKREARRVFQKQCRAAA